MPVIKSYVNSLINQKYNVLPSCVSDLGGGFYGKVFLADIPCVPYKVVVKFFLKENLCKQEKLQLELLAEHSLLKVPAIYACIEATTSVPYDALFMEYIEGKNAGLTPDLPKENATRIASQIVDNLISLHSVVHKEGFGELDAEHFALDWNSYYKV